MRILRSTIGKALTAALLLASGTVAEDTFNAPTGVGVRLEQSTVEQWKVAMQRFLPHYITYDLKLAETEHWTFKTLFGLLKYHWTWTDIRYDQPDLDMIDTQIEFTDILDKQMLKVNFATMKYWKIRANQNVDFIFWPQDSVVVLEFRNFDVKMNMELLKTPQGYLKPSIYTTSLNWGQTDFFYEDWFLQLVGFQIIKLMQVISQNSIYFLGDYILSGMMEPVMTNLMSDYRINIPLGALLEGQNAHADFTVDFRQTTNPFIGKGYMDMQSSGELSYNGEGCPDTIVDNNMHFVNSKEQSQIVLTESTATCWLNVIARSPVAKFDLNEQRWNQALRQTEFDFDSTSLADKIKIFEEKVGPNKPLRLELSFKDIDVTFGQYEVDMSLDFTACMSWFIDGEDQPELFYDELVMQAAADIRAESEVLHVDLKEMKLNLDHGGQNRDVPHRNGIKMTANEYREFLEDFSFTMSEYRKWLNDVVLRGDKVTFPYHLDEFETSLNFQKQKLHVMIGVEDLAYKYLEEAFWKDNQH